MNLSPVRWGVLGFSGHFFRKMYPAAQQTELVDLYAIASQSQSSHAKEQCGFQAAYDTYHALLEDSEVEAVYIPLPNHLHLEMICAAADAGKHILCEKPMCMSAADTRKAIEYAAQKNVLLMEAFMYRLHPQWRIAYDAIKYGEIGKVHAIHTTFFYDNKDPQNYRNVVDYGGGGIADIGCYAVSSARWLLGTQPRRVTALIEYDPVFKVDRLASAILDFGSAHALFTAGTQTYAHQSTRILGTGGTMELTLPFNPHADVPAQVTIQNSLDTRTVHTQPCDQYRVLWEKFSHAIRTGTPLPIPPHDALQNQIVLDAIHTSGTKHRWVDIEE